jgi:hypothetical protein
MYYTLKYTFLFSQLIIDRTFTLNLEITMCREQVDTNVSVSNI